MTEGPSNITMSIYRTRKNTWRARATCMDRNGFEIMVLSKSCATLDLATGQAAFMLQEKWQAIERRDCDACDGTGMPPKDQENTPGEIAWWGGCPPCKACDGTGKKRCDLCGGDGLDFTARGESRPCPCRAQLP